MPFFRPLFAVLLSAGFLIAGGVLAQTVQTPSSAVRPSAATEAFNAKAITARQWNRMKRRWMRDKVKWESCNKAARDRRLTGRRSWPVIAQCMTTR